MTDRKVHGGRAQSTCQRGLLYEQPRLVKGTRPPTASCHPSSRRTSLCPPAGDVHPRLDVPPSMSQPRRERRRRGKSIRFNALHQRPRVCDKLLKLLAHGRFVPEFVRPARSPQGTSSFSRSAATARRYAPPRSYRPSAGLPPPDLSPVRPCDGSADLSSMPSCSGAGRPHGVGRLLGWRHPP